MCNILYNLKAPFLVGTKIIDVSVRDLNNDGLKDTKVKCGFFSYDTGDIISNMEKPEWIFFQLEEGLFYDSILEAVATGTPHSSALQINENSEQLIERSELKYEFLGVWRIDEVVLTSEMYTGTTKDGDLIENLYDPQDYIGMEVEYLLNSFRLENHKYSNPEYVVKHVSF